MSPVRKPGNRPIVSPAFLAGSLLVLLALAGTAGAAPPVIQPASGNPPNVPTLVFPPPGAFGIGAPASLTATVSDPDGDSLKVRFYGRPVTTSAGNDFTLVQIPDTQNYVWPGAGGTLATFIQQTQWIVANRLERNIAYVAQTGDIVEHMDNFGDPIEWVKADSAMRYLEDPVSTTMPEGIPFGVSAGNHDIEGNGATVFYNQFFGINRFAGRSYYGGHMGNSNDYYYDLFSAGGRDFIVIGMKLTWQPQFPSMRWADSLLTVYSNRLAIISSHWVINNGNPGTFSLQGQALYDSLKDHSNLILMIGGHLEEGRRSDTFNGHTIHTLMANYQSRGHGGDGWLRILEFSPANNEIRVRTYTPMLDLFETDPDSSSEFTLSCPLTPGDAAFHLIATIPKVGSGQTPSIPWAGLIRGERYEWYVTVDDGTSVRASPTQWFLFSEGIPPNVSVLSPSGGEVMPQGGWMPVTWTATDDQGITSVDLQFSRNGPMGPYLWAAKGLPNSGQASVFIPAPATTQGYVRVLAHDSYGNVGFGRSQNAFTVQPPVGVGGDSTGALAFAPVAPNPARGTARFGVTLPDGRAVRLAIFDIEGHEVRRVIDGPSAPGPHVFTWDGRGARGLAPTGLYLARLEANGNSLTRKFVLTR